MAVQKKTFFIRIDRKKTVPMLAETKWEAIERVFTNHKDIEPDRSKYYEVKKVGVL